MLLPTFTQAQSYQLKDMKDVDQNSWSYPYIEKAFEMGLLTGTSPTTFSPAAQMSRGMIATVIYRMAGSPDVSSSKTFPDVLANAYYSKAISWISSAGIMSGHGDGTFKPDAAVSREQIALIAQRYRSTIEPTKQRSDISGYTDYTQVSDFAYKAMEWAVNRRIITGSGDQLNPKGMVTREQCAKILVNTHEGHGNLSQKIPVGQEFQLALYDATNNIKTYQAQVDELESQLAKAQSTYDQLSARKSKGSAGFFESLSSTSKDAKEAYEILTDTTGKTQDDPKVKVYEKTRLGAADDATSLENMEKALKMIPEYYKKRQMNGLSLPNISHTMMAIAQKQINYSVETEWHSYAYQVGENLAWGGEPFVFWYDMEKELYDKGVRDEHEIGHFLNIISKQYTYTGVALRQYKGQTFCSQTFSYQYMRPSSESWPYDQYLAAFQNYKNSIDQQVAQAKTALDEAKAKAADLPAIKEKLAKEQQRLADLEAQL